MKIVLVRKPGGPEVLELVEVPDPVPGPGEVVVRNDSIGVMAAHVLVRQNRYRFMPDFPAGLGTDCAGRIHAVGPGVTAFKVGDPVYVTWRMLPTNPAPLIYSEQILVPANAAIKLADGIDLEAASGLGNYSAAWAMLNEAPAGRDYKSVLVVGSAGTVGSCIVETAHHMGKTVIGLVSTPEKAAYATSKGVDHTINYKTENILARVLELTGGKGVDLLIDHLGGPNYTDYFDMLNKWGMIVSINGVNGKSNKDVFEEGRNHSKSCVAIRFFAMHGYEMDEEGNRRVIEGPLPLMMAGKLRSQVAARFPLAEVAKAHELFESGKATGRIVLKP